MLVRPIFFFAYYIAKCIPFISHTHTHNARATQAAKNGLDKSDPY